MMKKTMFEAKNQTSTIELINQQHLETNQDLDAVINDLEMKISTLKKENQAFYEEIDDLNDLSVTNDNINKNLTEQLKNLDKQIKKMNEERNSMKKIFDKNCPDLKDKLLFDNNINIDNLLQKNDNYGEDILNYMSNKS